MEAARKRVRWGALVGIAVGIAFAIAVPESAKQAAAPPLLSLFSLGRMVAAYLLALVFAVAYGTTMALSKRAAVVMLPLLDILQSVPILGVFRAAPVRGLYRVPPCRRARGRPRGFLIFTSM